MDIQRFFDNWHLEENPFQAEEARNDSVYARTITTTVTHPDFQKIFGQPTVPSTSIVFGEKGSGKTAMRLMMERRFEAHNATHDNDRVWMVRYDDLNPFLDQLSHTLSPKNPEASLDHIRLADHQDAILSLAVTELVDQLLLNSKDPVIRRQRKTVRKLSRELRLDLAVLALLYDNPRHGERETRWHQLKRLLRVGQWVNRRGHGIFVLGLAAIGLASGGFWYFSETIRWEWQLLAVVGLAGFLGFGFTWVSRFFKNGLRARKVCREIRTIARNVRFFGDGLWDLPSRHSVESMLPEKGDQDKRYEATKRFLQIINRLGYRSLAVFVDRLDEPVMINSDAERMRKLVWPMLNNKFLQQEGFGAKMLLPLELGQLLESADADFKQQARLDKQNMINPLRWTGSTLYDLCTSRFRNCQKEGAERIGQLNELFEDDVDERDLVDALDQMHQPRDAFKFLYAVIQRHCQNTTGETGNHKIPKLTLDFVRQEQSQRVVNLYRGS
ncbi:MAG: hypothetical protein GVY36_08900 [Verrucomicrobia bacterium]|jgi:hypothetical protein|nr:hypothetical protein [Verrucomicrobiota bacterium]